jgi:hypothetical protein
MSVIGEGVSAGRCVNHPSKESFLRCGKCGDFICPRCTVQTPVGARCRQCAQLRRLPQYDVGAVLILRSGLAGLAASVIVWWLISFLPYLRFFLSILVGVVVGEVVSRLARRRVSRPLEVVVVADAVLGLLLAETVRAQDILYLLTPALWQDQTFLLALALPAIVASFVAVVKLR